MYYIWSLITSIVFFVAIQFNEYKKNPKDYNLYTLANFTIFAIIFLMTTIIFYLMFSQVVLTEKVQKGGTNISSSATIDPTILKKIPDSIYTGFTPYDT